MKLNNETLRSIAFGAVEIEEKADGLHFYHSTAKQRAAWDALNKDLGTRSACSCGIRLDFHTDSPWLTFEAAAGNKFEVLINDLAAARVEFNLLRKEGVIPKIELGAGEKRVTLVFPSHEEGVLRSVELADGSTLRPHTFREKILFIGDSITQGWNAYYDSNSYAWQVTRALDAESVINGIGGAYYHTSTFDTVDFEPDRIFIAYGTNDFNHYHTQKELREQMDGFLTQIVAAYPKEKICCIAPIYRFSDCLQKRMGSWEECRALIRDEIAKKGIRIIEGYNMVPHLEDFFADTVHPNDMGFSEYAKNLLREIKK